MPLSYNDVRKLILQTLEERPEGTKVEVPNQQNYELALLDYVQQLETTMSTSMVGIADATTEPIEPAFGACCVPVASRRQPPP